MHYQPSDLLEAILAMKNGQVAADLNNKFNEVLHSVLNTAGKGELTIKFKIEPSRLAIGGAVVEVEASHECKLKKPEPKIGRSIFFVGPDGRLTRDNPDQEALFGGGPEVQKEK